ncbi:MFS transporter [Gayadomonas joobiniege]|uniref:MFS transporter n=1 Tax=Gayadomonas joobiniege TaxID=1234606 RepID=UPI0003618F5B|nr:MFS transporter [Gayadomonas joobiniege]
MRDALKLLRIILPCYGLLYVGNGLLSTLISVRAEIEGFNIVAIGFIMAAYFFGILISTLLTQKVLPLLGYARSFVIFTLIIILCTFLYQIFIQPIAWILIRFVAGFAVGSILIITESWVNGSSSNKVRGRVLSVYMLVNNTALGLGQIIFTLQDPASNILFNVAGAIFIFSVLPLLVMDIKAPQASINRDMALLKVIKRVPLGLLCAFTAGVINASILSLGPVFTQKIGFSYFETGYFMAAVLIGGLLLQLPVGRLSDGLDRRLVMLGAALLSALVCLVIVHLSSGNQVELSVLFIIASVAYGALSMTLSPIGTAYSNDNFGPSGSSQVSSAVLMSYGVGAILGPILASTLMSQFGGAGLFISNFVALSMFIFVLGLSLCRPKGYAPRV